MGNCLNSHKENNDLEMLKLSTLESVQKDIYRGKTLHLRNFQMQQKSHKK
jgi:hypothetical protein